MRAIPILMSSMLILGCAAQGRTPTPPSVRISKADAACPYHCKDYDYEAGQCYEGWQCDAAGLCLTYEGTPDHPDQCIGTPPPPPMSWRDGLPAGALDLYIDLPIVITTTGWANHLPFKLTGDKTGDVKLTYVSGEAGCDSGACSYRQTVTVAADGSFTNHVDWFGNGQVVEDLTGSLQPNGVIAVSHYHYLNGQNGADWVMNTTFSGAWAPMPADWWYR